MKLNKSILFGILTAAFVFAIPANTNEVKAEIPNYIYSGVEGGEIRVELPNSLYSEKSPREWYLNDVWINPLPEGMDISKGTTAILKLAPLDVGNHGQVYRVKDKTEPEPSGTIKRNQTAMLYVTSKEALENGTLSVLDVDDQTVGDKYLAKDLTLVIDGTAYPHFQTLKFLINGNPEDYINVPDKETVYAVREAITGKTTTVRITGESDQEAPAITSLQVINNLANKYALEKTVRVEATDNIGLPARAFYWEAEPEFATSLKNRILDGAKSRDLGGIAWAKDTTLNVLSNGTYTVFVRDKAGNITFKDIVVSKISSSEPTILSVIMGKAEGKAYFDIKAEDKEGQPLKYRLHKDGKWQTSNRLKGVKDGDNTIYVMNEAGKTVSTTKTVNLSLFLGEYEKLSSESLYDYITVTPASWTRGSVKVTLELPQKVRSKLVSMPYSINGSSFSSQNSISTQIYNDKITFSVKDTYGNIYESKPYTVKNIDNKAPTISLSESEGTITVNATDDISGISRISIGGKGLADYTLKSNSSDGVKSDTVAYKTTSNGTYRVTITDFAGNRISSTVAVTAYSPTGIQNGSPYKSSSSSNRTTLTAGTNNYKTTKPGGSASGSGGGTGTPKISYTGSGGGSDFEFDTDSGQSVDGVNTKISDAGHTEMRETTEAVPIEVTKSGAAGIKGKTNMLKKVELDDSNNQVLNKLIWLLPVAILGAVALVLVLNRKKK